MGSGIKFCEVCVCVCVEKKKFENPCLDISSNDRMWQIIHGHA